MKVVLIRPYCKTFETMFYEQPLGLASIAAVLEKEGYQVSILDFLALGISSPREIEILLKNEKPDVVGVGFLSYSRFEAVSIIDIAKGLGALVVAGGEHVTFDAKSTLFHLKGIDVVVLGEGEETMLQLVKRYASSESFEDIEGIAYKKNGEVMVTRPRPLISDLSQLPFPAYHLLPMEKYRYAAVIGSRGCPYRCIFCAISKFWGNKIRFRPYQSVVDEIEYLMEKYHFKYFAFKDVNLFLDKEWAVGLFEELIKRDVKIKWDCLGRVDLRDKEIFSLMKEAGCEMIIFGVEAGTQESMERIKKEISKDQVRRAQRAAKEAGIPAIQATYILGNPGETKKDIEATGNFAVELNSEQSLFGPFSIYPGTFSFELALEKKVLPEGFDWFDSACRNQYKAGFRIYEGVPTWQTPEVSRNFLEAGAKRFYVRTFFASVFGLSSWDELKHFIFYYRARYVPKGFSDCKIVFQEVAKEVRIKRGVRKRIKGMYYLLVFFLMFRDWAYTERRYK